MSNIYKVWVKIQIEKINEEKETFDNIEIDYLPVCIGRFENLEEALILADEFESKHENN